MCRLLAYQGETNYISDHIFEPEHSLIEQSHHATKGKMSVNADGYGLAWQSEKSEPVMFKDTMPAWGCDNLHDIAYHTKSPTFIAHVRASTSAPVSRLNCHPFKQDGWVFAHNGQINDYQLVQRQVENALSDKMFSAKKGQTDSEIIFLGLLDYGFDADPVAATQNYIKFIESIAAEKNIKKPMVLTAAMFKDDRLVMIRYASTGRPAPSLFKRQCPNGICFASEPYAKDGTWSVVPDNSITIAVKNESVQNIALSF